MADGSLTPDSQRVLLVNVGAIVITILVVVFVIGWVFGDYAITRKAGIGPIDVLRIVVRKLKKPRSR